ncbi:MAG TPA: right-handed parallel beta-helix repeat-containing protein [Tepidisphaeraceae bacterium]
MTRLRLDTTPALHTALVGLLLSLWAGRPAAAAGAAEAARVYYVSPAGRDIWSGRLAAPNVAGTDGPFATLARARDAARTMPAGGGATILVEAGEYELGATLTLGGQDSGLTLAAAPGAKPVLRGGTMVRGFQAYKGQILKADLRSQGFNPGEPVRQLLFEGTRQPLARYPNFDPKDPVAGGWAYAEGKPIPMYQEVPGEDHHTFRYKAADARQWAHPEDVEVFVFARYNWWNDLLPIRSIDRASRTITLAKDASYAIRPGDRYFFQNALEELDAPGEWYFDRRDGMLYFWPPSPIKANSVCLPRLETMIDIAGASHVTLRGLTIEGCNGTAIALRDCTDCLVAGNTIRNVGSHVTSGDSAVSVSGGKNCGVAGNDICYVGGTGITLSGGDRKTLTPAGHWADNNVIHHVGVIYKQGVGIELLGVGNRASHNLIHDGPRFGIMFSGNNLAIEYNEIHHVSLETEDTGAIYTGGRDWISSRGTVVRYNYFHDILGFGRNAQGQWETPHFAWGVYLDDDAAGVDVIGNVLVRCPRALIHLHNGRDNVIENNVLVDGTLEALECNGWTGGSTTWKSQLPTMIDGYNAVKDQPAWRAMRGMDISPAHAVLPDGLVMAGNVFRRNIVVCRASGARVFKLSNVPLDHFQSDDNVVWHMGLPPLVEANARRGAQLPAADQWPAWQQLGLDKSSVVADPMFVDPSKDDYRLQPASPALKLGFRPIPFDKIGPHADANRATWPVRE